MTPVSARRARRVSNTPEHERAHPRTPANHRKHRTPANHRRPPRETRGIRDPRHVLDKNTADGRGSVAVCFRRKDITDSGSP
eukprot:12543-Prymnesium_polylepis.1